MTMTLITDIAKAIRAGEKDSKVDALILKYKEDWGINLTLQEWKLENYALLRRWSYPPMEDLLDAMVKLDSTDNDMALEGQAQYADYVAKCLAIKAKYPKSEKVE